MVARHRVSIEDAILGIDLGSTSTRVCLWCPKRRQENIDIENTENTGKVPLGDFPSVGYPFESEGPVYLGDTVDPTRRPISLKYGFYALAEADKRDDLLKQYVLVTPLTAQRENPAFRDRLRQGLRELFLTLQKRIDFTCDLYRLRIKTIGISVPSQWTTDFENVYRELIISVFKDSDDISFHTETEALAHALLRNHQIALPEYGENMYDVYLFLDFGGHNMNGCIFNVVHGQDHDASFYRIGDPFGAGGGSEQWSYHVGEQFAKIFSLMRGRSMTSEEWKTFTDQFDNCKPSLGPGTCDGRLKVGGWDMTLPSAYIDDCFERSHTHVFQKANEYIKLVSEIHGATPYVIVSGGTAKHKTVQSRLRNMCKEHGIKEPLFSNEWSITHGSGRIARGVAYAAGSRLTFDQFLQRGAAFGIQRKQKASRGDPNSSEEWNNVADLLFCKNIQTPLELEAGTGRDEFKIICDPFFEPETEAEKLHFDRCYDFLYLGKLKRGKWKITFSVIGTPGSPSLVLKSTREYVKKTKKRKRRAVKTSKSDVIQHSTNPLPMFFDGGANCFFVDPTTFDNDYLCQGLPSRSPEDAQQANMIKLQDYEKVNYESEGGDSVSTNSAGDNAAALNEPEDQASNDAATAPQEVMRLTASTPNLPTLSHRFVLQERYQNQVVDMSLCASSTKPTQPTRNMVKPPPSQSGQRVQARGGPPLVSSRRSSKTVTATREISNTQMVGGLKSRPVDGTRRIVSGIEEDTESDMYKSSSSDSE